MDEMRVTPWVLRVTREAYRTDTGAGKGEARLLRAVCRAAEDEVGRHPRLAARRESAVVIGQQAILKRLGKDSIFDKADPARSRLVVVLEWAGRSRPGKVKALIGRVAAAAEAEERT